jgi:hypothetical protein
MIGDVRVTVGFILKVHAYVLFAAVVLYFCVGIVNLRHVVEVFRSIL